MKNYVICTNVDPETTSSLVKVSKEISLQDVRVHFVKIIEIQIFSAENTSSLYPREEEYPEIENYNTKKMKHLAQQMGLDEKNCFFKCFFELKREEKILIYLKEVNADLVVTSTRGKHGVEGFFTSSFTDFLCKFSPCDVLVTRERKHS
ncbi:MAG: universal stress protein [Rhizobacter sp.]|nr:universal stress protein [Bacteriovorax sp.]